MNLERADRAVRRAAQLLGRKLPADYPGPSPHEREKRHHDGLKHKLYGERPPHGCPRPDPPERLDPLTIRRLVGSAGIELLEGAVKAERDAIAAQAAAVECIRQSSLGGRLSWAEIGELVGISSQGAFKRWRRAAEGPEPQLTIDDEAVA